MSESDFLMKILESGNNLPIPMLLTFIAYKLNSLSKNFTDYIMQNEIEHNNFNYEISTLKDKYNELKK